MAQQVAQQPPQTFYRVQHANSFTMYEHGHGFEARAGYVMDLSYWVNKQKFESHLNWKARPLEETPYISLFDNMHDAMKRVQMHVSKGHRQVMIAEVRPRDLLETSWTIRFEDRDVELPVWQAADRCTFIATSAIRRHLRVGSRISQVSEWFAVGYIPSSMIDIIWKF